MVEIEGMNKWYAYDHVNGELHVKRYFDQGDIDEARKSDFVARVDGPFEARDRDHAIEIAMKRGF